MRGVPDEAKFCFFEPKGVACEIPSIFGRIPASCRRCGWHPEEAKRRKAEIMETGRCTVRRPGMIPKPEGGETI